MLADKDRYPAWKIEQWHVYPDPRARFADPTNPDRPPMPPDDPAARDLAPNPQKPGKAGIARTGGTGYLALLAQWDAQNRAALASSSEEQEPRLVAQTDKLSKGKQGSPAGQAEPLPLPSEIGAGEPPKRAPGYLITLEQAVELGLINSRDYQDRREDLYLAALPVTLERFAFAAQFFATEQAFREWAGRELPREQRNRWRLNGNTGFTKLFPTGALLLLRYANQTVINLAGTSSNPISSTSTLGLDIVQPLLQGGGKAVNLEPLTQVERNLLYEIRDYARFRKEFYVAVATGSQFAAGGGVIGVPGGGGVVTGLGDAARPAVVPSSRAFAATVITGASPQGYLPIVLQRAQLANEEKNLEVLQYYEENYRNLFRAQLIDQAQFNQIRQNRLRSQSTVLQRTAELGNAIDRFKLQLGLPTDVPLELDDTPLRPMLRHIEAYEEAYGFKDIKTRETNAVKAAREVDDALRPLITSHMDPARAVLKAAERLARLNIAADPVDELRSQLRDLVRTSPLVAGTVFQEEFPRRWAEWEKIATTDEVSKRLTVYGEERRGRLRAQADFERKDEPVPEAITRRIQELDFEIDIGIFEMRLRGYEEKPWLRPGAVRDRQTLFNEVMNSFASFLREVREAVLDRPRLEKLRQLQEKWPELPRVCVNGVDLLTADEETALAVAGRYALENRFDLMNVRAQLVDSWRKIAVAANSLLGTFNVEYHLESVTPSGQAKPLAFSGGRTRHQMILNGELPLVRKLERNNYRATLIAYQRQRRALMEAEDLVLATVRAEVRQLRNLARNYKEIQTGYRQNVDLAYFQLDLASEFVSAPPAPTGPAAPPGTVGPPTAGRGAGGDPVALTQQLISAISSLVGAKNQLYSVWIDFQTNRLQLYRDLELMPLDFRGVWIDDPANCACGTPDAGGTAPDRRPGDQRPNVRPEQLPEPRPLPGAARSPARQAG